MAELTWTDTGIFALLVCVGCMLVISLRRIDRVWRATQGRLIELREQRAEAEKRLKKIETQARQMEFAIKDARNEVGRLEDIQQRLLQEVEMAAARPKSTVALLDDSWRPGDRAYRVLAANRTAQRPGAAGQAALLSRTLCAFGDSAEAVQTRAMTLYRPDAGWDVEVVGFYDLEAVET